MGPESCPKNPSYEDVCTGATGHVEVYDFDFAGNEATYEDLVRFFFQFHDPTTLNKQGNDKGTQYASVIYCYDDIQRKIANKVLKELQALISITGSSSDSSVISSAGYVGNVVSTDIRMATEFFEAKPEHQDYLSKHPKGYCNHKLRLKEWPKPKQ